MTPKEKALEIFSKMFAEWHQIPYESVKAHIEISGIELGDSYFMTKKCALIAVDEIIANIEPSASMDVITARIKYWIEVKEEIEKL